MELWLAKNIEYWSAGGLLLIPMVLVCFGIWACFFRSRERLKGTISDGRLLERALDRCETVDDAVSVAEVHADKKSGIGTFVLRGLADARGGARPMEAMQSRIAEGMGLLRKDFVVLAAFTAVAPLLGLLGTVMGMIDTFDAVSVVSGDTGSRVAAGISRALITTQFGLVVALPGVFGMARLHRMMSYAQVLMSECQAHVVTLLEHATERKIV